MRDLMDGILLGLFAGFVFVALMLFAASRAHAATCVGPAGVYHCRVYEQDRLSSRAHDAWRRESWREWRERRREERLEHERRTRHWPREEW